MLIQFWRIRKYFQTTALMFVEYCFLDGTGIIVTGKYCQCDIVM